MKLWKVGFALLLIALFLCSCEILFPDQSKALTEKEQAEILKQRNELIKEQNKHLDRIATALEKIHKGFESEELMDLKIRLQSANRQNERYREAIAHYINHQLIWRDVNFAQTYRSGIENLRSSIPK